MSASSSKASGRRYTIVLIDVLFPCIGGPSVQVYQPSHPVAEKDNWL